jgi:hypothetical protein
MRLGGEIALTGLDRKGLIDPVAVPVDDDDLTAVLARQSADYLPCEGSAFPVSIASDENAHGPDANRAGIACPVCRVTLR